MRQFNLACCLRPNIFELKLPASAGSPSAAFLIAAFPRASSHRLRSICWLIRSFVRQAPFAGDGEGVGEQGDFAVGSHFGRSGVAVLRYDLECY